MKFTIDKQALCIVIDKEIGKALGTGFSFLKENWVITAKHVVIYEGLPRKQLELSFIDNENVKANIIAVHPEIDLALLEYEGPPLCKKPLMPGYHEFGSSNQLIMTGYSPTQSDPSGLIVKVDLIEGFEVEEREREDTEITIHFKAEFSEGGNSGGAILGEGGNVVAVTIQTYFKGDEKYCIATSIRAIMKNIEFGSTWQKFNP